MIRRVAQRLGQVASSEASQIRCMAGSAPDSAGPNVKLPAVRHGISGRYASCLWRAAYKANVLTQVELDLAKVLDAAKNNPLLAEFMNDPTVSKTNKSKCMREVAELLGVGEIAGNFFAVMCDNGRLRQADKAYKDFVYLMEAHRGEVRAVVSAAEELEPEEAVEIQASLTKMLEPGQSLLLTQKVNPSLIGGFVVELGEDKYIDLSISKRLQELEKVLSESI